MSTPTNTPEPLVSDNKLQQIQHLQSNDGFDVGEDVRNIYEADRAKTRALMQQLVDALTKADDVIPRLCSHCTDAQTMTDGDCVGDEIADALALAKSHGITLSTP